MKLLKTNGDGDSSSDINISPLIDMVFILLIFFIVTTVFVEEKGIAAKTPDPGLPDETVEAMTLRLTESGRVFLNGREIASAAAMVEVSQERGDRSSITIEVESGANVNRTVALMDACQRAGCDQISLRLGSDT